MMIYGNDDFLVKQWHNFMLSVKEVILILTIGLKLIHVG